MVLWMFCECPAMFTPTALPAQLKAAFEEMMALDGDAARRAYADAWRYPAKGGARLDVKIFSREEEETLVAFCNIAIDGGFGVSQEFVHELMCDIVSMPGRKGSSRRSVSLSTVKVWMREHGIRRYRANSIDPARVAKATERVRDAWFARVDRCAANPCPYPYPLPLSLPLPLPLPLTLPCSSPTQIHPQAALRGQDPGGVVELGQGARACQAQCAPPRLDLCGPAPSPCPPRFLGRCLHAIVHLTRGAAGFGRITCRSTRPQPTQPSRGLLSSHPSSRTPTAWAASSMLAPTATAW